MTEITKLTLRIGERELELTLAEARELLCVLRDMLEGPTPFIPLPRPAPYPEPWPYPETTCTTSGPNSACASH